VISHDNNPLGVTMDGGVHNGIEGVIGAWLAGGTAKDEMAIDDVAG